MQDGHNDLLGLVAIEGVVLVNIRGLNVACQVVASLVLVLLLLLKAGRIFTRRS